MSARITRVPFRIVLASILGLWLCYFLLITLRGSVVDLPMQGELVWRRGVVCLAGAAITLLLWLVIRLVEARPLAVKIAVALIAALPASLAIAQVNRVMFDAVQDQVAKKIGEDQGVAIYRDDAGNLLVDVPAVAPVALDQRAGDQGASEAGSVAPPRTLVLAPAPTGMDRWQQLTDIALGRYFLLLAWAALYLALLAGAQAQAAQRREERFRTAAKAAELRSLRYQVNPHFLFNALNSLSALVMTGRADRAEEMIQTLSAFYRHSLADDPTADLPLADEFDLQRHYLEIETTRFPDRLRTRLELPDDLSGYRVPGMILQPLVENSVKYGVSASRRPVTVTISAREEYGRLVLTVTDDGPGKAGAASGFGIGLANVRDRLMARFGEQASIVSGATLDGYETQLRLPLVTHG
ncbi:histidine kinase [Erythrobacter sp. QSSC1-22B]|nr:histidine kinase [Erythrobacter sp. QSSC1-22B]